MSCPEDCSGHGQCLSMAEAAAREDGNRLIRVSSYEAWDAGMIYVSAACVTRQLQDAIDAKGLHFVLFVSRRALGVTNTQYWCRSRTRGCVICVL